MRPRDRSQMNPGGQPAKRMPQGIEHTLERAGLPVNELMAKVAFDLRAQVRINQGGKIDDVARGWTVPWIIREQLSHVPDILGQFFLRIGCQADHQVSLVLPRPTTPRLSSRHPELSQSRDKAWIFDGSVPGPITIAGQFTHLPRPECPILRLFQHGEQFALYNAPARLSAPLPLE